MRADTLHFTRNIQHLIRTSVTSVIGGMDFPTTLNSPVYWTRFCFMYLRSWERCLLGISANSQQPTSFSLISRLYNRLSSNKILITGNLSSNRVGVASAPILLSYADNPNSTWQEIGVVYTGSDGGFASAWYPTGRGSFLSTPLTPAAQPIHLKLL